MKFPVKDPVNTSAILQNSFKKDTAKPRAAAQVAAQKM